MSIALESLLSYISQRFVSLQQFLILEMDLVLLQAPFSIDLLNVYTLSH